VGLPFPKSVNDDAPARAARIIIENDPLRVDVGQANGNSFLCWAGAGLDAAITEDVESRLEFKRRAPMLSYAVTAFKGLFAYEPAEMRVVLDDSEVLEGRFPLVVASNIRLYARYFKATPGAKIDDGLLDLIIFTESSKPGVLYRAARMVAMPGLESGGGLIRRQVRKVTISADPPQPYHLDGDPLGKTPVEVRSLYRKLLIRLDRSRIADALS
jgi:diacylglycerol kinase family enzyme